MYYGAEMDIICRCLHPDIKLFIDFSHKARFKKLVYAVFQNVSTGKVPVTVFVEADIHYVPGV